MASEAELVKLLVSIYPSMTDPAHDDYDGEPSSWIVYSNDFTAVKEHFNEVCHASMQYDLPSTYDNMITAVPYNDADSLAYLRTLIFGLFKQFSDRIELCQLEDEYYIKITQLDTWPANVLYNFAIATRTPIEFRQTVRQYAKLVRVGVPEMMSLNLGRYLYENGEDDPMDWVLTSVLGFTGYNSNHHFLDHTSDWSRVMKGDMRSSNFSSPYRSKPTACRPCNTVWGFANPSSMDGKTVREIFTKYSSLVGC